MNKIYFKIVIDTDNQCPIVEKRYDNMTESEAIHSFWRQLMEGVGSYKVTGEKTGECVYTKHRTAHETYVRALEIQL